MTLIDDLMEIEFDSDEVKTVEEVAEMVAIDRPTFVALDTETTGLRWHAPDFRVFAMSIAWRRPDGSVVSWYIDVPDGSDVVTRLFDEVIGRVDRTVFHNAKFDLHALDVELRRDDRRLMTRRVDCTMLMDYCLDEKRHHGLKELCSRFDLRREGVDPEELRARVTEWRQDEARQRGLSVESIGYDEVPDHLMVPYAVQDAWLTVHLFERLSSEVTSQVSSTPDWRRDVRDIYEAELRTMWSVLDMEVRGMRIDLDYVVDKVAELTPALEIVKMEVRKLVGWDLNPGSTEDVAKAFAQFGVPTHRWVNRRTGKHKLPEWVLSDIVADPDTNSAESVQVASAVLRYREDQKMLSSYFQALLDIRREDDRGQSIVRCNVKQHGARTGRMSITDPALQTIPRSKGGVRDAFVARDGCRLVLCDYSQQELRVLAHFLRALRDDSMFQIYVAGGDLHWETAEAVYQISRDDLDPKVHRENAKAMNFGVVYGMGEAKAMAVLGASTREEGKRFLELYNDRFPGLRELRSQTARRMRDRGYILTPFGRRHRESDQRFVYKAVNSLIQGTSADLTKAAMVKVSERLIDEAMEARLVLQIHDEIIVEAPIEEVERVEELMRTEMTTGFEDLLDVPLEVDSVVVDRWSKAKG